VLVTKLKVGWFQSSTRNVGEWGFAIWGKSYPTAASYTRPDSTRWSCFASDVAGPSFRQRAGELRVEPMRWAKTWPSEGNPSQHRICAAQSYSLIWRWAKLEHLHASGSGEIFHEVSCAGPLCRANRGDTIEST
jgi:hypothetical protein